MQYTRLGNTGLIISRLAFGAMTFGSAQDSPMAHVFNTPEKTADALVGRSLEAGINFFDTADGYANGASRSRSWAGRYVELTPAEVAELDALTAPAPLYPNWFHTRTADQVSAQALGLEPLPEEKKPAAD